jgi:hypothetical protein
MLINFNMNSGAIQKFKDDRFVFKKKLGSASPTYNIVIDTYSEAHDKFVIRTALDVKDSELDRLKSELRNLDQYKTINPDNSRYLINFIEYFRSGSYFCLQLEFCEVS